MSTLAGASPKVMLCSAPSDQRRIRICWLPLLAVALEPDEMLAEDDDVLDQLARDVGDDLAQGRVRGAVSGFSAIFQSRRRRRWW